MFKFLAPELVQSIPFGDQSELVIEQSFDLVGEIVPIGFENV